MHSEVLGSVRVKGYVMSGIDIAIVVAVTLLVALAVAAGLQLAQNRADVRLAADRRKVQAQLREAAGKVCQECGTDLCRRS